MQKGFLKNTNKGLPREQSLFTSWTNSEGHLIEWYHDKKKQWTWSFSADSFSFLVAPCLGTAPGHAQPLLPTQLRLTHKSHGALKKSVCRQIQHSKSYSLIRWSKTCFKFKYSIKCNCQQLPSQAFHLLTFRDQSNKGKSNLCQSALQRGKPHAECHAQLTSTLYGKCQKHCRNQTLQQCSLKVLQVEWD